jgi:hypothetical protein
MILPVLLPQEIPCLEEITPVLEGLRAQLPFFVSIGQFMLPDGRIRLLFRDDQGKLLSVLYLKAAEQGESDAQ